MGNWQSADQAAKPPLNTAAAAALGSATAAAAARSAAYTPAFDVVPERDYNPQVKQGIGPELPRPNPVRIPTRRELASYGIKLPSQRMAEEQAREEADQQQPEISASWQVPQPHDDDNAALQEAQLREAFHSQQQPALRRQLAAAAGRGRRRRGAAAGPAGAAVRPAAATALRASLNRTRSAPACKPGGYLSNAFELLADERSGG